MTNHIIDNSITEDLGKTILWQYDKSINLRRIIDGFGQFYGEGVERFWDSYPKDVIGIDTATAHGLSVWGKFIGFPRPMYLDSTTNEASYVSDEMYRRIIKARFFLMKSSGSSSDISKYLSIFFPAFGTQSVSSILLFDNCDMSMSYGVKELLGATVPRVGQMIYADQVVAIPCIYKVNEDIEIGTTWADIQSKLGETTIVEEFNSYSEYIYGDPVVHEGEVYVWRLSRSHYPGGGWDDSDWELVARINNVSSSYIAADSFISHIEIYVAKENIVWSDIILAKSRMMRLGVADICMEEDSPITASPWKYTSQEEKDIFNTISSRDPSVISDVRYDPIRSLFPYPAGVKDNERLSAVAFGFFGQEPRFGAPEAYDFGSTEVDVLTAKDGVSAVQIRTGSSLATSKNDPEVGSFYEDGEIELGYKTWDETSFIPNEIEDELVSI